MSTRERWIVYPLLFLTLGIVMRDKVMPLARFQASEVAAGRIRCNQLQVDQVVDGLAVRNLQCGEEFAAGKIHCKQLQVDQVVSAGGLVVQGIQCGELLVGGPNGRPTVLVGTDAKTKGGVIETLSPAGAPLVVLQPTDSGGVVAASDFKKISSVARPEKPKTPSTPAPKAPSKEPEKAPAKASK
jgi:hypothetical protein